MAGEEAVQITATATQKAMEITVELMRAMVIPTLKSAGGLAKKGVEKAVESIKEAAKSGNVTRNAMLTEAAQSGSAILSSDNQFAEDVSKIAARAKQEGIPIHIIGSGGKQSIEFLERDKAVMQNIMQETIAGNIKSNPSEYAQFSLSENNILPMKSMLEENGVECRFFSANGKTFCAYHAYDAEKVGLLKQDFQSMRNDLDYNLKVERSANGIGALTDAKSGKFVDLSQFGGNVRQYQIVNVLQKELGYSKERATLAANKVCDDLGLDPKEFFAHTEQLDELKSFKTNIRFDSDDRLLQDISFSEAYFRGGESPHISLSNGDNSVTITPDNMSPSDIKEVCMTQLEMSEQQADKAVEKAIKINDQIKSQYKELAVDRTTGISQQIEIDRTSKSSFTLTIGATKKQYDLKDARLAEKLQKDLGISSDKAARIIGKAQKQSSFINNFERFANRKSEKPKKGKELLQTEKPQSKGARK